MSLSALSQFDSAALWNQVGIKMGDSGGNQVGNNCRYSGLKEGTRSVGGAINIPAPFSVGQPADLGTSPVHCSNMPLVVRSCHMHNNGDRGGQKNQKLGQQGPD